MPKSSLLCVPLAVEVLELAHYPTAFTKDMPRREWSLSASESRRFCQLISMEARHRREASAKLSKVLSNSKPIEVSPDNLLKYSLKKLIWNRLRLLDFHPPVSLLRFGLSMAHCSRGKWQLLFLSCLQRLTDSGRCLCRRHK